MDSRVVQSQVNENDKHPPHLNIDSQRDAVSPGSEDQSSDHDSKSTVFMNKIKTRAKKFRNTIKNFGQHEQEPTPIYDTEAIKSTATPTEKVKDLVVSEVDYEGTKDKGDGKGLHDHDHDHDQLGEGLSSTNEINQNTATEKPRVLEKDLQEQGSRPETYNHPNYQNKVTDPSGLDYDSEDVKKGALVSDKVEDLNKSEIDENTATEKQRLLEKDPYEKESRPEAYNLPNYKNEVTDPSGLDYDSEDVKRGALVSDKVEDLNKSEIDENTATEKQRLLEKDPYEKESKPEAYNLPNYQTEVTDPTYDSETLKNATPASEKVEDLKKSEIDFKRDEPHHNPLVEDLSSTPEINQNIATEKPIVFENDPQEQGSVLESYDLPNHQTKVTDPRGEGNDEINGKTIVEESLEKLNVQDEPKPIIEPKTQPNIADTEYPSARSYDQFEPQTKTQSAKEENFNNITDTVEKQPYYESVETQPKHKDETENLSATASETFSPENDEAYEDKVQETHDDYEKVMTELKEEVPETSTGDGIGTETRNESVETQPKDKDEFKTFSATPENNEAYEDQVKETHDDYEKVMEELKEEVPETSTGDDIGTETKNEAYEDKVKETHDEYEKVMVELKEEVPETGTGDDRTETKNEDKDDHDKGVPVKNYLAEKLKPGEDDKALSEVISETLHKKKEEPMKKEGGDKKSEKVSEETSVESPGKGMVDRFKGAVGSWFYTPEEKQSPQVAGDEDLSKNKDSVVEGERVSQVKNE